MTRMDHLRGFVDKYKPGIATRNERAGGDPDGPVIIEESDGAIPFKQKPVAMLPLRKCKVHRIPVQGLSYFCQSCNSLFCLSCITNVLLPEGTCMVCEAPIEISEEYRDIIDHAMGKDTSDHFILSGQVTTIEPEIWRRFEELELEEDVVDEVIDRLKYIPPEDRLKYLDAYFHDEDEVDDDL